MKDETKAYLRKIGKKGGKTTKAKLGPDHFRKIGRLGGLSRSKPVSKKVKRGV